MQNRDKKEIQQLLDSVRVWFNQPQETNLRVSQADSGLKAPERRMLRHLSPQSRVLDIGCAAGRASIALARKGHIVTGIDVSEKLIEKAQQTARANQIEVTFQVCDPVKLSFSDGLFDAVLLLKTYCYVPGHQNRLAWLEEIARVLRPDGWLFLSQYIIDDVLNSYDDVRDENYRQFASDYETLEEGDGFTLPPKHGGAPSYVHFFMETDLLDELKSSPFKIVDLFREDTLCYCSLRKGRILELAFSTCAHWIIRTYLYTYGE